MNALFIPRFLREKAPFLAALISLTVWVHPQALVMASANETLEQNQLVFEVKNLNLQSNAQGLKFQEITDNDPLVNNLKIYLQKFSSPLAPYAQEMVKQPQWQRALAISWVESNFCKRHADNNCSGIGVAPGHKLWRKYATHLDWFKDMSALMEKPIYKEKYATFQKMRGVYVQPGSANWVNGANKKYNELVRLTQESEDQRKIIAQKAAEKIALITFPENIHFE
ncbi:MAG: hypothetical protein AAB508_02125 [Patescibacteria group bacterium]